MPWQLCANGRGQMLAGRSRERTCKPRPRTSHVARCACWSRDVYWRASHYCIPVNHKTSSEKNFAEAIYGTRRTSEHTSETTEERPTKKPEPRYYYNLLLFETVSLPDDGRYPAKRELIGVVPASSGVREICVCVCVCTVCMLEKDRLIHGKRKQHYMTLYETHLG